MINFISFYSILTDPRSGGFGPMTADSISDIFVKCR